MKISGLCVLCIMFPSLELLSLFYFYPMKYSLLSWKCRYTHDPKSRTYLLYLTRLAASNPVLKKPSNSEDSPASIGYLTSLHYEKAFPGACLKPLFLQLKPILTLCPAHTAFFAFLYRCLTFTHCTAFVFGWDIS